eukprot:XP_011615610.1 PREDICTED: stabilin-2 [Takifugu rubripes]
MLKSCPLWYRQTPRSTSQDCRFYIRTASLKLPINGCSFECYRQVEVKSCCPGFWGPDCVGCPVQADQPCSNRGACSDGLDGTGLCSCQTGFVGTACEDCEPGRYGPTCSSACSCVHGLCDSGVTGSGRCTCFSGYKGPRCDQELPECAALSCPLNSRCMEEAVTGQLLCQCLPGYQKSGQQCLSINPCLQQVCHVQAVCVHTGPNQHNCACNKGYSGDGRICMAIDPCQSKHGGCPGSERCIYDGPGMDSQAKIRIHGSRQKGVIVQAENVASNGMIHLINKLMDSVPPIVQSDTQENMMKIIADHGKFGTFKSLLQKTDLEFLMDLPGPITVFAPVDAAFDVMTEGHLAYLSSPEGHTKLVELLRNHIVSSAALEVYNIVSIPRVFTLANQAVMINVSKTGQIFIGGAAVLEAAVEAKNGRLYIVDSVLTPPSIMPVLPHRCDVTETKGFFKFGCIYTPSTGGPAGVATGCSPLCNITLTTPTCCQGFYGPDCSPCPGGHQNPCSGHGQCSEGIGGNGTCVCDSSFRGSRCQYCSSSNKYGPNCDKTCSCIHGQCDNRPDSDGRCKPDSCAPGFTGLFCDRQTAACGVQVQFCHAHADCDFSHGTVRCICKPGYQGDGITCVESDPCAPPHRGGCSPNAKCVKTGPNSHICQCLTGWREDGDECQPINKCHGADRGGCHPNATCIYVGPGQSDCTCKGGYKGNGHECEALNQCVTAERSCHYQASCLLLGSQWTCVCDDGYVGNGHMCYGTVQQELMILQDASDFFTWTSVSGLSDSLSDQNLTLLVPSSVAVGKMSLEDTNFWTTKGNLPSLIRNHMIPGVHPTFSLSNLTSLTSMLKTTHSVSATAERTAVGGATITTSDITATNGLIHIIDQVLVPDRKLSEGLLATLMLRPEFSLFRSYLIVYNLTEEIEQAGEYTVFAPTDAAIKDYLKRMSVPALDVNTTRYHVVTAERLLKTDLQPGGYKQTMLGFSFQLGIFPRDGKLFVNNVQIDSSNLLSGNGVIHGLTQVLSIISNRCDETTYLKFRGSCVDCLFSKSKMCPNDTVPDISVRKKKCVFTVMFEEERLLTLGCRTTCLRKNIVPRCCGGFFGEHCKACPGPSGLPCYGNGVCVDGTNGTGVCQCNKGFNGTACEMCEGGKYGVHCDQDCTCKNGRCNEGLTGDGTCECDVGWRGVLCDEKIEPQGDLCGSIKCHTSANCVVTTSGFKCLCAAGFRGNGTVCQARDACAHNNGGCSVNAACKRTLPGRRDCVCHSGFSGDGLVCVEINACLEGNQGCHVNAECLHVGPNKTSCICLEGYSGDGRNCEMINLCEKRNGGCSDNARCNMSAPGVRTCTCSSNYVGDGFTCRGTVGKELLKKKLRDFYFSLMMTDISLKGRGPFTVFVPSSEAFEQERKEKKLLMDSQLGKDGFARILRSHIVMCHTLLPVDLSRPRNLTSLSGLVLTTSSSQGKIFINQANVTYSDDVSINGIFHVIDKILVPLDVNTSIDVVLNLTDVAERHGYKTFYKLLEDSGVMDLLSHEVHQPATVFLPSDEALVSLPPEQKNFLFHKENRPQLVEYLKFHILPAQKIFAEHLVHLDLARTLQGSPLSFRCGGTDAIGEIFVNDGKCRIIQRHLRFNGGIAYGIDCLLTPPSLGGRCDTQMTVDFPMVCAVCSSSATHCPKGSKQKEVQNCDLPSIYVTRNSGCLSICTVTVWQPQCCRGYYGRDCLACPGGINSPCSSHGTCDDGHLGNGTCSCDTGFGGVACELCSDGFYGAACKACNCTEHGSCDSGRRGTGACFCDAGWVGERCESHQDHVPQCSPGCSPNAVCQENNTCVCRPFYEGDGFTCTGLERCQVMNGGCATTARCSQAGDQVSCSCAKGYTGDGFVCQPVDQCASGDNGGCHEHATCTMTAPGKRKCSCKQNYIGDGIVCELKQLPISRCLQDNGGCHPDARCSDLHFEDTKLGVFHHRSDNGQYKLNYTAAQQACSAHGGTMATYNQLYYAQQGGMNMCAAGWLDQARVAYPTTYSNPLCGFGHVGIVDYGIRKNLSETWDTFCYRMKEVKCDCSSGFIGDGFSCTGNLLQVLQETPTFSNFLTQIQNFSLVSEEGRRFVKRLSDLRVQSTLFVPDNSGLPVNQTLTRRDIEFHLSEGRALPVRELRNGSRIRTRVGSLSVLGVPDMLTLQLWSASFYINHRFIVDSDILASNGIIHVLEGPLEAPPPHTERHVAHRAGIGVGVVLLITVVVGVIFVGYRFYSQTAKPFHFHYFKEDKHQVEKGGLCDLLQDSGEEEASGPEPSMVH